MELIVSDFGNDAPNLQHHEHKKQGKEKEKPKLYKTTPIIRKPVQKKVSVAQEDDYELEDPVEYEKSDPMSSIDIDAYTSSIIAEKNGRSISQMMAQDEEDKQKAKDEFKRQQMEKKKATNLANSLQKKANPPPPARTDADDVLDLVQKLGDQDDTAER